MRNLHRIEVQMSRQGTTLGIKCTEGRGRCLGAKLVGFFSPKLSYLDGELYNDGQSLNSVMSAME